MVTLRTPEVEDYAVTGEERFPETAVARWNANIAAIRTAKQLEAEDRAATPAEQRAMGQYSGFGDSAFNDAFQGYAYDRAWQGRKRELEDLVSEGEYRAIRESRLNAFYTSPEVVRSMWTGLEDMGVGQIDNPRVLEPSAGSGRFLAMQPPALAAKSTRTAVELDATTAVLLKHLYPQTDVYHMGFEEAPLPNNSFDIAISNVPFGNYPVHDPEFLATDRKHLTRSIHNYFFAKTLDKLKPGGVMAFVTTHHTMDAPTARNVREYLAEQADLIGAVRLPAGVFPDTQVVTDILYLRKRLPGDLPTDDNWVATSTIEVPDKNGELQTQNVNRYFMDHPERVLGNHSSKGSMYAGSTYTVQSDQSAGEVTNRLNDVTSNIVRDAGTKMAYRAPERPSVTMSFTPAAPAAPQIAERDQPRHEAMGQLRDKARNLLKLERGDEGEDTVELARVQLRNEYQSFVDRYGVINSRDNERVVKLMRDPLLPALEIYNRDSDTWQPSDIFRRRVIGAAKQREVNSVADALSVSYNESGRLDFDLMGQLTNKEPGEVKRELAQEGLIFHNPIGNDWESADQYLTGRVRDKLRAAQEIATRNTFYHGNVDALRAVQPEDIPPGEIRTPLGAPWIPQDVVNDWAREQFRVGNSRDRRDYYKYSPDAGQWGNPNKIAMPDYVRYNEWGTPKMGADEILLKTMQGKTLEITRPHPTEKDKRVRDLEGIVEAQQKAQQMQESFSEWVWQNPERNTRLARIYNDTHNAIRPRVFDGSHQTFPGMTVQWQNQMEDHQRDAVFRVVQDGTTLLAHEVGFGKTAVMVAANQERRRLGLTDKPIFVLPKATHKQFASDYQGIYPDAKLLVPEDKSGGDFSKGNREQFMARIATGDWDAVLLTSEQFQRIPVSAQTEAKWLARQVEELEAAYSAMGEDMESGSRRQARESRSQKDLDKKIKAARVKLQDLLAEMAEGRDKDALTFEQLGVDQIYVDEADRYKNLPFATSMGQVKGLTNTESKRAWDMFLKVQYVQGKGGNQSGFSKNGVVFATGTPVSNTLGEAWTMMRYLQLPEMRRRGLQHFDAWAKTYGQIRSGLEQSPAGRYKVTQRFAKFVNAPELSQLFQNVADVRVASEVPKMLSKQPRLRNEQGDPERTVVVAPPDKELLDYMRVLQDRVDDLPNVEPEEDNMLSISNDARKASLDMRLVDPDAKPNPEGKVPLAAKRIAQIYRDEEADKGTQLVFLDLGTPKSSEASPQAKTEEEGGDKTGGGEQLTAEENKLIKDVYSVLRNHLVEQGVPVEQVAFIHDYKGNEAKRKKLFQDVNDGKIRVLVGSTETVGVGVNVQSRAAALHHLDVPWRPRDIEQREGRIIRQGNLVYGPKKDPESGEIVNPGRGVQIYNYVQERSFDEFMWQAVEVKAAAVKSLMKRNVTSRDIEDIDSFVLGAGEAKALASGNPLLLKSEELKNKVNTLRIEQASHRNQTSNAVLRVGSLERVIENNRSMIPHMERDAQLVQRLPQGTKYAATVGGQRFDNRNEAGEAMVSIITGLRGFGGSATPVGTVNGFELGAVNTDAGVELVARSPETGEEYRQGFFEKGSLNPAGIGTRYDNLVKGIPARLEKSQNRLAEAEEAISLFREQSAKPFAKAQELSDTQRELEAIQRKLSDEGLDGDNSDELAPAILPTAAPSGVEPATLVPPQASSYPDASPEVVSPAPVPAVAPVAVYAEDYNDLRSETTRLSMMLERGDAGSGDVEALQARVNVYIESEGEERNKEVRVNLLTRRMEALRAELEEAEPAMDPGATDYTELRPDGPSDYQFPRVTVAPEPEPAYEFPNGDSSPAPAPVEEPPEIVDVPVGIPAPETIEAPIPPAEPETESPQDFQADPTVIVVPEPAPELSPDIADEPTPVTESPQDFQDRFQAGQPVSITSDAFLRPDVSPEPAPVSVPAVDAEPAWQVESAEDFKQERLEELARQMSQLSDAQEQAMVELRTAQLPDHEFAERRSALSDMAANLHQARKAYEAGAWNAEDRMRSQLGIVERRMERFGQLTEPAMVVVEPPPTAELAPMPDVETVPLLGTPETALDAPQQADTSEWQIVDYTTRGGKEKKIAELPAPGWLQLAYDDADREGKSEIRAHLGPGLSYKSGTGKQLVIQAWGDTEEQALAKAVLPEALVERYGGAEPAPDVAEVLGGVDLPGEELPEHAPAPDVETQANEDAWLGQQGIVRMERLFNDYRIEETGDPSKPYKLIGKRGAEYWLTRQVIGGEVQYGEERPLHILDARGTVKRLAKFNADYIKIPGGGIQPEPLSQATPESTAERDALIGRVMELTEQQYRIEGRRDTDIARSMEYMAGKYATPADDWEQEKALLMELAHRSEVEIERVERNKRIREGKIATMAASLGPVAEPTPDVAEVLGGVDLPGDELPEPAPAVEPKPDPGRFDWEEQRGVMETPKHEFSPGHGMKYIIRETGKRFESGLTVTREDGRQSYAYYPPGGMYNTLEEAQAAAEQHYAEWQASSEAPPPVQLYGGGGPFGGGRPLSLEEIQQREAEAPAIMAAEARREERNRKSRETRSANAILEWHKTLDRHRSELEAGGPEADKARWQLIRNVNQLKKTLHRFPEDVGPELLASYEATLQAAQQQETAQ